MAKKLTNDELCDEFEQLIRTAGRRALMEAFDEIRERLCPRPPGWYEQRRAEMDRESSEQGSEA